MIVLIDNYDSFSYNVYQLIGSVEPDIKVVRNDEVTIEELEAMITDEELNAEYEKMDEDLVEIENQL